MDVAYSQTCVSQATNCTARSSRAHSCFPTHSVLRESGSLKWTPMEGCGTRFTPSSQGFVNGKQLSTENNVLFNFSAYVHIQCQARRENLCETSNEHAMNGKNNALGTIAGRQVRSSSSRVRGGIHFRTFWGLFVSTLFDLYVRFLLPSLTLVISLKKKS